MQRHAGLCFQSRADADDKRSDFALHEGVATRESIDGIMKLGMNHPMGPLTLADFIGLDVCLAILNDARRLGRSEVQSLPAA
jgi:3-hydroxybutyryl-CoA dehydrogenase